MIAFQLWSRTGWRDHSSLVDSGGDTVKTKDAAPSQRENFLLQQGAGPDKRGRGEWGS